jgi:beta-glucosidase
LEGFQRINLQPAEEKTVSFPIGYDQLKFWNNGWVVEGGDVQVMMGSSSQDIRLKAQLHVDAPAGN